MSKYSSMRKERSNGYKKGSQRNVAAVRSQCVNAFFEGVDIELTEHVMMRHRERYGSGCSDEEIRNLITSMLSTSRLVGIIDGKEHRACANGMVLVVKRKMVNGREKMVVITELLSRKKQMQRFKGAMCDFVAINEM